MLYHYTSINSLVQILENKSLKFNNLTACDDLDEAESKDIGKAGKYVYVSSWTEEEKESIPMWSQYSGNMSGVRIGMREMPFKLRIYENNGKGKPFETFVDLDKYYTDNRMAFAGDQPKILKVEYVEEESKIQPQILTKGSFDDIERFCRGEPSHSYLDFSLLGRYKRTCWAFQREIRYKIFGTPIRLKDMESAPPDIMRKMQGEAIKNILDNSYKPFYQALFIELDESAINEMEIVFGPRMNDSEKILLRTYLKSKGLEKNYRDSSLRIQ